MSYLCFRVFSACRKFYKIFLLDQVQTCGIPFVLFMYTIYFEELNFVAYHFYNFVGDSVCIQMIYRRIKIEILYRSPHMPVVQNASSACHLHVSYLLSNLMDPEQCRQSIWHPWSLKVRT